MKLTTTAIDVAKEVFGLYGAGAGGKVLLHKRISRKSMLPWLARLEPCLFGMEACGSAQ